MFSPDLEHPETHRISRNSNVFGKSAKTDSRVQNIPARFRVTAQARFVGVHSCFICSFKPRNVISVENDCAWKKWWFRFVRKEMNQLIFAIERFLLTKFSTTAVVSKCRMYLTQPKVSFICYIESELFTDSADVLHRPRLKKTVANTPFAVCVWSFCCGVI